MADAVAVDINSDRLYLQTLELVAGTNSNA
jgi:hypothetical protein